MQDSFRLNVDIQIVVIPDGTERFFIHTPFCAFGDGDCIALVLKKQNDVWVLSDEANTYMHASIFINTDQLKDKILGRIFHSSFVEDRNGELIINVQDDLSFAIVSMIESIMRLGMYVDLLLEAENEI